MSISKQIKELRDKADIFEKSGCAANGIVKAFRKAADTIESLSAKLQAANEKRSADCGSGWIPCEEEMPPEDNVDVLVWYEYFRFGEYNRLFQTKGISFTYDGKWSGFVNGQCGWRQLRIIAWQPMPEDYHEP